MPESEDLYFPPGGWREQALCLEYPEIDFHVEEPNITMPPAEQADQQRKIELAKAICRLCLVKAECLEYALSTNQQFSVWGELTAKERKNLKRRQRQSKKPNHKNLD